METMNCFFCGFDTSSDDHVFNLKCGLSNGEADQVEAEVREAADVDPRTMEAMMEVARDVIAYARFVRDLSP